MYHRFRDVLRRLSIASALPAVLPARPLPAGGMRNGALFAWMTAAVLLAGCGGGTATNPVSETTTFSSEATASAAGAGSRQAPATLGVSLSRYDPLVILTWGVPRDGSEVTGYEYRQMEEGASEWSEWMPTNNGLKCNLVVMDLDDDLRYFFQVKTLTTEGDGMASAVKTAYPHPPSTLNPQPNRPRNLRARGEGGRVVLTWDKPIPKTIPEDTSSRETIVFFLYREGSGAWRKTDTDNAQVIDGLELGRSYTFELLPISQHGIGESASISVTTSAATTPDAPTELVATADGSYTDFMWHAPLSDGGSDITSYEYQRNNGSWKPVPSPHPYEHTHNFCPYRCRYIWPVSRTESGWSDDDLVRVRAVNSVGAGSASNTTPVSGSPRLSVADAQTHEGPDATLDFVVTLSKERRESTTVEYATADGIAVATRDYTATSGTLYFAPGDTAKTVSVEVLEDLHDEGYENLFLILSNADGAYIEDDTATGVIWNSDPLPKAWMVRLGRTVGSQAVDALTAHFRQHGSSHAILGGINLMHGAERNRPGGTDRNAALHAMTAETLQNDSSFHFSNAGDSAGDPVITGWGRIDNSAFRGRSDGVMLEGDVLTGLVGFDAGWGRMLAGVMVSQSDGTGTFRREPGTGNTRGRVDSTITAVYPYAKFDLNPALSVWGLAGLGTGEIELHQPDAGRISTDIRMRMRAAGIRKRVMDGGTDGLTLSIGSDAMWVGMENERTEEVVGSSGEVTRFRFIAEGERSFRADEDTALVSTGQVGFRYDGGDAEAGTGLEIGCGLYYRSGSLTIESRIRTLIAHEEETFRDWGASASLRIEPNHSGRGLSLRVTPGWGQLSGTARQLWTMESADGLKTASGFGSGQQLDAEFGYGFGFSEVLTPYLGLSLDDERRSMRTGVRWRTTSDAVMTLEATRSATTVDTLMLSMRLL